MPVSMSGKMQRPRSLVFGAAASLSHGLWPAGRLTGAEQNTTRLAVVLPAVGQEGRKGPSRRWQQPDGGPSGTVPVRAMREIAGIGRQCHSLRVSPLPPYRPLARRFADGGHTCLPRRTLPAGRRHAQGSSARRRRHIRKPCGQCLVCVPYGQRQGRQEAFPRPFPPACQAQDASRFVLRGKETPCVAVDACEALRPTGTALRAASETWPRNASCP